MRILILTHSFNGMAQRLYCELGERGHELSVELDISDAVTREAIELFAPDVLLAPYLKRALPEDVWRRVPCLIVHPGVPGDRGPSSLDWALHERQVRWGVTVLHANAVLDGGDIWATAGFAMREARKSSLYRDEVTDAAARAVIEALERMQRGERAREPASMHGEIAGRWHPPMRQADRAIDWERDGTDEVLLNIRAADSAPGVLDAMFGEPCHLFDAHRGPAVEHAKPGEVLARRDDALLRATRDGSVWIGHVRRSNADDAIKLPATLAFADEAARLPERPARSSSSGDDDDYRDICYEERGAVGLLHFDFYNGAMSTDRCRRLCAALDDVRRRPTRVLVLMGGRDFWSNGIHLNVIEHAASPADESWRNIQAIDDVAASLLAMQDRLTVSALQGAAGAGGAFLSLAADRIWARPSVVLNLHYRNMGNLYGSEYWTYLLPRRAGRNEAERIVAERQPLLARQAAQRGLVDEVFGADAGEFREEVLARATRMARDPRYDTWLEEKRARRTADEAAKPLATYRDEELRQMRRSFYGFDTSYHVARSRFVRRAPHSWTPRHLAHHRLAGAARRA
jgi:putative two-component system hydrogenase maturation factor HypX/HoxX